MQYAGVLRCCTRVRRSGEAPSAVRILRGDSKGVTAGLGDDVPSSRLHQQVVDESGCPLPSARVGQHVCIDRARTDDPGGVDADLSITIGGRGRGVVPGFRALLSVNRGRAWFGCRGGIFQPAESIGDFFCYLRGRRELLERARHATSP